jgi:hypothetical protein
MSDKKIVKTVRFNEEEYKKVELFLIQNPGMDFSTLIRLALNNFIESPKLNQIQKKNNLKERQEWN